jgi:hypothetical protein
VKLVVEKCSTDSERLSKEKTLPPAEYSRGEKPALDKTSPADVQTPPRLFWTGHLLLVSTSSHIIPPCEVPHKILSRQVRKSSFHHRPSPDIDSGIKVAIHKLHPFLVAAGSTFQCK